jgi:pyruvate dehydrogenase E2 component (dihydrolipoamide acetyltransferase)
MSGTLYARLKGQGPKTIVLLHGFGGDHQEWTDIQPDLARDGLVIAYDLPGHGRSLTFPGSGAAGETVKAILADLAARGRQRVHVAGFSMGGVMATLMALRAPDQIASLTLLAPGGFGPQINSDLLGRFAAAANADELRAAMNEMSGPGFVMPTRNVAALAAVRFVPGQRARLIEIAGAIARPGGRQGEIPRESLASLAMPVTVMWGTADPVLPFSQSENLPAGFTLQTVEGAGHMLPVEARKAVTAAIRRNVRAEGQAPVSKA